MKDETKEGKDTTMGTSQRKTTTSPRIKLRLSDMGNLLRPISYKMGPEHKHIAEEAHGKERRTPRDSERRDEEHGGQLSPEGRGKHKPKVQPMLDVGIGPRGSGA